MRQNFPCSSSEDNGIITVVIPEKYRSLVFKYDCLHTASFSKEGWKKNNPYYSLVLPVSALIYSNIEQGFCMIDVHVPKIEDFIVASFLGDCNQSSVNKVAGLPTQPFGFVNMHKLSFPIFDKIKIDSKQKAEQSNIFHLNFFSIF